MPKHNADEGYSFEAWVEWIVARHFESQSYEADALRIGRTDLLCALATNKVNWLIEVKGITLSRRC